ATSTLTDQQRDAAFATIFGSDAIRAANILVDDGTDAWNAMAKAQHNESAASEVANARMKGMSGAIEYFRGSVDSFMIGAGLPFLDFLGGAVRGAADALTGLGDLPDP